MSSESSNSPTSKEEAEKPKAPANIATPSSSSTTSPSSSTPPSVVQPKQPQTVASPTTATAPMPTPSPVGKKESDDGPLLFHFAECTNCHHILPISTNTEKYFPILSKDPRKPKGLGETCMRCSADSWVLVVG